jgi:dipeptidase E
MMKLLLTSAGIANDSIRDALVDLLGRPVEEAAAVLIPTAIYALPDGPADAWEMVRYVGGMGWKRLGIIELTALPTIEEDHWLPAVEEADAIIVGGGNTGYLSYWLQQSGFADKLPDLARDTVYFGVSAGSAWARLPSDGAHGAGLSPSSAAWAAV